MAVAICLQDWVTAQGGSASVTVTQSESGYFDMADYQEFVAYVEIGAITNGVLALQNSPTLDNTFFSGFKNSVGSPIQWTTTGIQSVATFRIADTNTPLFNARYLRWVAFASAAGTWSIAFRIWLSLNQAEWR